MYILELNTNTNNYNNTNARTSKETRNKLRGGCFEWRNTKHVN